MFDKQASSYDQQWQKLAPIYNSLYFLLESVFVELPSKAQILCVGVGTGKELIHLARKHPGWYFTAIEPSGAMLDVCRHKVKEEGITSRCYFHEGYLDSLPKNNLHDAATCLLVSQFIMEKDARSEFFRKISSRLKPDGILTNVDLSTDVSSKKYDSLLRVWQGVMKPSEISPEGLDQMKAVYAKNVAILPPDSVASIIKQAGFEDPVQFFQTGLIRGWFAKRISHKNA